MPFPTLRKAAATVWVGAVIGCSAPQDLLPPSFAETDSAGVRILESTAPEWTPESAWSVESLPTVIIGTDTATGGLHEVLGATRLGEGQIAVLERSTGAVTVYDRNGEAHRQIGRRGRGPGEFTEPEHLRGFGDSLIVWEARYGRITILDSDGAVRRSWNYDLAKLNGALGEDRYSESFVPIDAEFVVGISREPRADRFTDGVLSRPPVELILLDAAYNVLPLGWFDGLERGMVSTGNRQFPLVPLFPRNSSVTGGGNPPRIYVSNGDSTEVLRFGIDGKLEAIYRWRSEAAQLTNGAARAIKDNLVGRNAKTREARLQLERVLGRLPKQTHFPPIGKLLVDRLGCLWVEHPGRGWSILDQDGRYLGDLEVDLQKVYDVGGDYLIGLAAGPDDQELVVEFRLHRNR